MLNRIEEAHPDDGEILFRLAGIRELDGQPEMTARLLSRAIQHGCKRPEAFLKRSRFRADNDAMDGTAEDLRLVLASEQVAPPMVREAVLRLARLERRHAGSFVEKNATANLDPDGKFRLAHTFNHSRPELSFAVVLWEQLVASSSLPADRSGDARQNPGLCYMGLGRCSEAAAVFRGADREAPRMDIAAVFNHAMALWGVNGTVDQEAFQRVVELDRRKEGRRGQLLPVHGDRV